jgi:RHS repeat-associated protein
LYGYDRAGQLTNEIAFTNGLAGGATNSWVYDEAGNWITGDGKYRLYNDDNEFLGISSNSTKTVTVTGEVEPGPMSNKWYHTTAECRNVSALASQTDGTFSLPNVPLYPGVNDLVVTVTDVSGNSTQQVRHVTKNVEESFSYDNNGNLTNWMDGPQNWMYEWDWTDRLTKVSRNGVVLLQNWYDNQSRRVAKQEVVNGQTMKWLYLSDGWNIIAVMKGNGQLLETFTRGVGLAGDIGTLVAVTHHAGSAVTPGTYCTHHNHRGDIVLVRNGTTTTATCRYAAFGNLTSQSGTDVSRFKFSSKERERTCGFSYYGYRFFVPQWQRWLNRDPRSEPGVNLYCYVLNSPLHWIDPLGKDGKKTNPPTKPPPTPPKSKPKTKCKKCEELRAKLNKPPAQRDANWVLECYDFCHHVCDRLPNAKECWLACANQCDDYEIPSISCVLKPPKTGKPTK